MMNERTLSKEEAAAAGHSCASQPGNGCADIEVSRAGYRLWRAAGRPAGRFREFLSMAEKQLIAANVRMPASGFNLPQ
jgi:hypothetical protein